MALTKTRPTADPTGLTVDAERLLLAGLIAKNADGTPRVGIFPTGTPLVTGRASMGYDIAPFKGVSSRTGVGVELQANDAVTTVATTAAPASNSRLDVIWFRAQFTANTDATNTPVFGVTQGVAAGLPTKPAIPAGATELAVATILSTTTTTAAVVITQTHQFTAAAGATVLVRNRTELDAWAAPVGATARTLDSDLLWVRRSSPTLGWYIAPGQRLAYMSAVATNGVVNTLIGSIASTIALPIGQRVRVLCAPVSGYAVAAGPITYSLLLRNNSADVAYGASDKKCQVRAYQGGGNGVVSLAGTETEFVTTVAAKVSAGLYVDAGTWTTYGPDGQELWIESA